MSKFQKIAIVGLVLLGIIVLIFLVKTVPKAMQQNIKALQEDLPSTYNLTSEDSSIINKQFWQQLKPVEVRNTTTRNPITLMMLDSAYFIFKYCINLDTSISLKDVLNFQKANADVSTGFSYGAMSNTQFYDFKFVSGKQKAVSNVYVTYFSNKISYLLNSDSLIICKTRGQNLSIRYTKDEPKDIVVIDEDGFLGMRHNISMGIIFFKRAKSLYFLLITPLKSNGDVPNGLISELVK